MIISVNTDYLRALLRNRCGGQIKNGNSILGLTGFGSTDGRSIFPLGMKTISNEGGISNARKEWYAPRLHVVDDVSYCPATNCTITDSNLDLSSQSMVIKSVIYSAIGRKQPSLILGLE